MKQLKKALAVLLAMVLVFGLAACGKTPEPAESTASVAATEESASVEESSEASAASQESAQPTGELNDTSLYLVTDLGTIDDKSFNQGSFEGLQKLAGELGLKANYLKPAGEGDQIYLQAVEQTIADGAKVVVTPGFLFIGAVGTAQSKYPDVAHKIKFFIGDVRNLQSCRSAMPGVDYIFHAAALKQVPSCEFFPMEAVKTNVIGTDNVLTAAIESEVGAVICLSTDKAAYPINAMGITKAIEEKIAVAKSRYSGKTKICCTRYGNVMCSRGSVIPLWIEQIRNGNPITLTEPKMTRFIMSLEEAVDLVLFAFEHGQNGDILVQKAPACTIQTQAEAVCELFGGKKDDIKVIGIRHGEKMYETLLTNEECAKAEDMGDFYRVPADNRGLNYDKFFKEGEIERNIISEFNSNNTRILTVEETKTKIAALEYIQKELSGEGNFVQ